MDMNKRFESLNEYQKAAVLDHGRALLVNAHVGSGKTTVLTSKILYLHFVKSIPLQSMVVLTFTNKAAKEIKSRLQAENPQITEDQMPFFGTFHGVARRLLSTVLPIETTGYAKDFEVADTVEILDIYEKVIRENKLSVKYKNKIKKRIEKLRQGTAIYGNMKHEDDMTEFFRLLKEEKIKSKLMEFDDLMDYAVALLDTRLFCPEWIIVDEFQDCDPQQIGMIEKMYGTHTHLFAVGDPNQIIYSWRGSKSDIFETFRTTFNAKELSLPINYRSTANILQAAKPFLGSGQQLEGVRETGNPIIVKRHYNTFNEALYLVDKIGKMVAAGAAYRDFAVFYRKQKQAEVFMEVFTRHGIPFESSTKGTEIDEGPDAADVVRLMTLHASKGLEFKYVFISCANLGMIPLPVNSREEEEEEKRLFFVGMTRAKDYLEISYHTNPTDYGVYGVPSPYLRMIPEALIESEDFGSRAGKLAELRREVKRNMDKKQEEPEAEVEKVPEQSHGKRVIHDKYGQGQVVSEDENNITVIFEAYGEKTFSKLFCSLKYLDE